MEVPRIKKPQQTPKLLKRSKNLFFLVLLFGFFSLKFGSAKPLDTAQPKLAVTYLYCGQGDAIVIQTPQNKVYLIDAGTNDQLIEERFLRGVQDQFDAGKSVVAPFLISIGTKKIDGILISHPHLDHYGGTFSLLKRFKVVELIDSGFPSSSPHYLKLLKELGKRKIKYKVVKEGENLYWDTLLTVEILGPREKLYPLGEREEQLNNHSIVLKLTYGKVSFLFTGDIEAEAEEHLIEVFGEKLKSQILKVAHHGSWRSSTQNFLEFVNPEIAVISCGKKNEFGHPHEVTLRRLKKAGTKIYRTDQNGSIQISTDGKKFWVRTF